MSHDESTLIRMRDSFSYRGPDDAGIFMSSRVGLGSRRLAILDLSAQGHMPMLSKDGRYSITHNGEVYNYRELRSYLEGKGHCFHSDTDTEVILNMFIECGPSMLDRFVGMFAFAIWDSREQSLFIARDRTGVKPLYYSIHQGCFYFSSEQKALFAAGIPIRFDPSTWKELLFFRYVAGERTPYAGVQKLLPGHYLTVKSGELKTCRWWALHEHIDGSPQTKASPRLASEFLELFNNSVRLRRISDVPVGVLLSGGLDSATIAAVIAEQGGERISSFTVRFDERDYDEGPLAQQVAARSGLDYHELFVSPENIPTLIEECTRLHDEPLVHGHEMQILAISRYAKPLVSVLLSGEGADEVFGGYVRHRLFVYPEWTRQLLKKSSSILPLNGRLNKASRILGFPTPNEQMLFSSAEVFPVDVGIEYTGDDFAYRYSVMDEASAAYAEPVRRVMYYDQYTYLQSLMDRNDRMTMGASIECREPYLDYRILQWAANIPTSALFKRGVGKDVIRVAMKGKLPSDILQHRKWGFGAPWNKYLRDIPRLRAWVENLHKDSMIESSPLTKKFVHNAVQQYLAGDNRLTPLIRQLFFATIWHHVCVQGETGIFD